MKKISCFFAAVSICVSLFSVVNLNAAERTAWVEIEDSTTDNSVKAEVKTNGSSCNGLITLEYDADALEVDSDNIVISKAVEMYAVNTTEAGKIVFTYVSEKSVTEGALITVTFEKEKAYKADSFKLTGTMYSTSGKELTNIQKKAEVVSKETKPTTGSTGESNGNASQTTGNNTEVANDNQVTRPGNQTGNQTGNTAFEEEKDSEEVTGESTEAVVDNSESQAQDSKDEIASTEQNTENQTNNNDEKGSKKTVIIVVVIAALVVILGGAAFAVVGKKKK